MTDKQKLIALLTEFGVEFQPEWVHEKTSVYVPCGDYQGNIEFKFTESGKYKETIAWD